MIQTLIRRAADANDDKQGGEPQRERPSGEPLLELRADDRAGGGGTPTSAAYATSTRPQAVQDDADVAMRRIAASEVAIAT